MKSIIYHYEAYYLLNNGHAAKMIFSLRDLTSVYIAVLLRIWVNSNGQC